MEQTRPRLMSVLLSITRIMSGTEHITIWTILKNASYIGAIFLGLSVDSYAILGIFMILDTILGVTRVYIVHGGQAIKSYRLMSGLLSKMTIIMVPLIIAYTGKGVGMDLNFVASAALSVLILSHAYSILGNIRSIHVRQDVYEFDAVSWALTKIQLGIEYQLKKGAPDKEPFNKPTNRDQTKP